jgi:hypothetical protein
MWYRSVLAQIFLDQQIAPFQMSKQDMLPDLEEMLTKMGKTTDEYYRMTKDQQQEIWSMGKFEQYCGLPVPTLVSISNTTI